MNVDTGGTVQDTPGPQMREQWRWHLEQWLWHIPRVQISQQWLWPLRRSSGTAQRDNHREGQHVDGSRHHFKALWVWHASSILGRSTLIIHPCLQQIHDCCTSGSHTSWKIHWSEARSLPPSCLGLHCLCPDSEEKATTGEPRSAHGDVKRCVWKGPWVTEHQGDCKWGNETKVLVRPTCRLYTLQGQ